MIGLRAISLAAALALSAGAAAAVEEGPGPYAVTAFGGVLLDNTFDEVLFRPGRIDTESAQLAGVALSARLAEPVAGLELGVEGQIVRHFGAQTHWEVNAPVLVARWDRFPWDDYVGTGIAFGLGLSMASEIPDLERANEGGSQPVMAYWTIELALGPPEGAWELVGRLHHRSTAFGTFGEEGGANALVLGLRHRF